MTIKGKLHARMNTKQVSDTFQVREFVVEYADNPLYPQFISFQLTQDRVNLISGYSKGDAIEVDFNLRGREWKNAEGEIKYFNTLEAWRITKIGENKSEPTEPLPAEEDDLPF